MRRRTRLLVESLESRRLLASVTIPTNLTGNAGAVVAAPIRVDTAAGIRAAEIRLTYDTDILNIDSNSIQVGSVWAGNADTQVTANVDDATGSIVLFVTSANPLSNISGSLAILNFTIVSGATAADTANLNLTSAKLNEGAIVVTPLPAAGADSTDGLITVAGGTSGNGSIGGFVFADANKNGTVDAGEAISGVTITLTNSSTGATRQVTSGSDGTFAFAGLSDGSYQLTEQQPAAYFEGGVNNLTAQVTAGASLTNQNFVEGGLLPSALFTRLRTTLVMPVGSAAWQNAISQVVQTVAATSATSSASIANLASSVVSTAVPLSSPSSSISASSLSDGIVAEGEANESSNMENVSGVPLTDIETRARQRMAAIEQAVLDLSM